VVYYWQCICNNITYKSAVLCTHITVCFQERKTIVCIKSIVQMCFRQYTIHMQQRLKAELTEQLDDSACIDQWATELQEIPKGKTQQTCRCSM